MQINSYNKCDYIDIHVTDTVILRTHHYITVLCTIINIILYAIENILHHFIELAHQYYVSLNIYNLCLYDFLYSPFLVG